MKLMRLKKIGIVFAFIVLYLVTSVPLGMFLYTLKSELGLNVFKKTGYHGYVNCLVEQLEKIDDVEE